MMLVIRLSDAFDEKHLAATLSGHMEASGVFLSLYTLPLNFDLVIVKYIMARRNNMDIFS